MQDLREQIKRIVAEVLNTRGQTRWGFVASVDPTTPAVRMRIEPEGTLTGWLPISQQAASLGVTAVGIPEVGMMGTVIPDMGDAEHGIVIGFSHNNGAPLPKVPNAPGINGTPNATGTAAISGEYLIVAFGSTVRLCADGSIYLQPGNGFVHVDGELAVNGDITCQANIVAKGNVTAGTGGADMVTLQHHKHPTAAIGAPSEPTPGA